MDKKTELFFRAPMFNNERGELAPETISNEEVCVPLYLDGRTVIGKAFIKDNIISIMIDDPTTIELMDLSVKGFSIFNRIVLPEPFIEEITTKEKNDEQ